MVCNLVLTACALCCAGQMHDAGEVLLTLYDALSKVAQANNQPHLLDRIFGLHVKVRWLIICIVHSFSVCVVIAYGFQVCV